jgi:ribosomal-protein-alanine N-acetyltransferase
MPEAPVCFDGTVFPRLETARLLLRELTADDVPALFALFADPLVTRYLGIEPFRQPEEAIWLVNMARELFQSRQGVRWAIAPREHADQLIGTCGYNDWQQQDNCAELGYELARAYWRQGLMHEALAACLRFGFEMMRLNRVEAEVTVENTASARLLLRLGFQQEGVLRQRSYRKGAYHDLYILALLRYDYWRGQRREHA